MSSTQFFKCLSDETRLLSTLLIFQQGELCVCELMEALEESQPKISRHLAQLRSCGILSDRRDKQWVYYALSPSLPEWTQQVLGAAVDANQTQLKACSDRLHRMSCRPQRCP
ncbi:metalloregulator ArsR/SmtB family transcription factor [Spongiibacter taiwanensis]|uniref:metalloregulator ArsR/SmtB family transcription factor n=1 Tax=Spongiibacter taiwanensis TaxID=1748242 RepID=UPI0025538936|nr:metalloregulator ArsR/SmtB family transcription factor [Spongiibacter taiwanensis]